MRYFLTSHNGGQWCSPCSPDTRPYAGGTARCARYRSRVGTVGNPSGWVYSWHTGAHMPLAHTNTAQWWGGRKGSESPAGHIHTLQRKDWTVFNCLGLGSILLFGSSHSFQNYFVEKQRNFMIFVNIDFSHMFMCTVHVEFTNVCIPKVQTRRLQEHTCHSSCLKHWVDTGTGHCWGRKRSSENHVGHTYILPMK